MVKYAPATELNMPPTPSAPHESDYRVSDPSSSSCLEYTTIKASTITSRNAPLSLAKKLHMVRMRKSEISKKKMLKRLANYMKPIRIMYDFLLYPKIGTLSDMMP